ICGVARQVVCFLSILFLSGCGPASATVGGEVEVDGKAVDLGTITFSSADETKAPPVTAEIKNGKYQINTVAGKKFVGISAFKITGERKESDAPNSPMVPISQEIITRTGLTLEVTAGANTKDWKLDTKDKQPPQ